MKKLSVCLFALLFCFTLNDFGQKIPITSKSDEAIELYKKGWDLNDAFNKEQAETAFNEALKLDPEFALAYLSLAMLRDNYDVRRKYVAQAMKHLDKVSEGERLWILARNAFYGTGPDGEEFQNFEKLVRLFPNDEKANYFFGFVNFKHGKREYRTAILHLKKAIELNPNFIAPYNELAYALMESKDFKNAEIYIKKYIRLLPKSPNPYDTYAEMLMQSGRFRESITMYDKVLSINSKYPWAIMGKAANLNFLDKHAEARNLLSKLNTIELSDYEDRHKWRSKSISFTDEGNLDAAVGALREQNESAVKRNDLQQQYESFQRIVRLYFEKGQAGQGLLAYEKLNEFVQSKLASESIKKNVANLKIYYQAYEAFLAGNSESAKQLLKEYEKTTGSLNNDARLLQALILLREKNFAQAVEVLKQTDLTNPLYQFWLAEAFKSNGDKVSAKQWFTKAASKNELNNFEFALVRKKAKANL